MQHWSELWPDSPRLLAVLWTVFWPNASPKGTSGCTWRPFYPIAKRTISTWCCGLKRWRPIVYCPRLLMWGSIGLLFTRSHDVSDPLLSLQIHFYSKQIPSPSCSQSIERDAIMTGINSAWVSINFRSCSFIAHRSEIHGQAEGLRRNAIVIFPVWPDPLALFMIIRLSFTNN
jgi:hypothetical protein